MVFTYLLFTPMTLVICSGSMVNLVTLSTKFLNLWSSIRIIIVFIAVIVTNWIQVWKFFTVMLLRLRYLLLFIRRYNFFFTIIRALIRNVWKRCGLRLFSFLTTECSKWDKTTLLILRIITSISPFRIGITAIIRIASNISCYIWGFLNLGCL